MRCSRQSGHGTMPSAYWKNHAPRIVAAPPAATTSAAVTAGLRGVNGAVVTVIDGLGGRVGHSGGGCHCRRATTSTIVVALGSNSGSGSMTRRCHLLHLPLKRELCTLQRNT